MPQIIRTNFLLFLARLSVFIVAVNLTDFFLALTPCLITSTTSARDTVQLFANIGLSASEILCLIIVAIDVIIFNIQLFFHVTSIIIVGTQWSGARLTHGFALKPFNVCADLVCED